ncbi:hypothetical protein MRB53_018769 [Persea americana]|uniref:Uncharacterized protein n=1 Tax=Persea americana TaxID=3435 RepID=A0ACC2M8V7_PERAE|nr:hypothetical protein MRB53_018769 [Persea americana]
MEVLVLLGSHRKSYRRKRQGAENRFLCKPITREGCLHAAIIAGRRRPRPSEFACRNIVSSFGTSGEEATKEPKLMQKDVLENMAKNFPSTYLDVVQHANLSTLTSAPLMLRFPLYLIFGPTCKGNVAVAGEAMHPMTPDLDHVPIIHHNTSSPFILSQTLGVSSLL